MSERGRSYVGSVLWRVIVTLALFGACVAFCLTLAPAGVVGGLVGVGAGVLYVAAVMLTWASLP